MQYKLATFGRGKDKVKRKSRGLGFFGDKKDDDGKKTVTLREPLFKRGLIGGAIGGGLGLAGGTAGYSVLKNMMKTELNKARNSTEKRKVVSEVIKNNKGKIKLNSIKGFGAELSLRPTRKLILGAAIGSALLGTGVGAINGLQTYSNRKRVFNDEKIKKDYKLRDK